MCVQLKPSMSLPPTPSHFPLSRCTPLVGSAARFPRDVVHPTAPSLRLRSQSRLIAIAPNVILPPAHRLAFLRALAMQADRL
jgi:hypothetical protein